MSNKDGQEAIEEMTRNIPAIAVWLGEVESLFGQLRIVSRKAVNALESLGEPELGQQLDSAMQEFEEELMDGKSMQEVDPIETPDQTTEEAGKEAGKDDEQPD